MFIIRDQNDQLVAIATREVDAIAMASSSSFDKTSYTIEDTKAERNKDDSDRNIRI